jgi:hypothetical protein
VTSLPTMDKADLWVDAKGNDWLIRATPPEITLCDHTGGINRPTPLPAARRVPGPRLNSSTWSMIWYSVGLNRHGFDAASF